MSLEPSETVLCINSALKDVRECRKITGHTLEAYASAMRGRDLSMESVDEMVMKMAHGEMRIDCRPGCTHCCHQLVACSSLEILVIARLVRERWPKSEIDALIDRLKYVAGAPIGEAERCSRDLPCPLLIDHKCSVYENRPGSCRALYSFDVKACSDGLDASTAQLGASRQVPSPDYPAYIIAALNMGLDIGQHERGLDTERVDLVRSLLLALKDETVEKRWLNGRAPFRSYRVDLPVTNLELIEGVMETYEIEPARPKKPSTK